MTLKNFFSNLFAGRNNQSNLDEIKREGAAEEQVGAYLNGYHSKAAELLSEFQGKFVVGLLEDKTEDAVVLDYDGSEYNNWKRNELLQEVGNRGLPKSSHPKKDELIRTLVDDDAS